MPFKCSPEDRDNPAAHVKSLGRWYTKELKDMNRAKGIITQMDEDLAKMEL